MEKVTERKKELTADIRMKMKHLELLRQSGLSVSEFLDYTLVDIIGFTKSQFGYIFLYNEDKEEFSFHSWSEAVMQESNIKDQTRLYKLGEVGLWGEVVRQGKPVIINDYRAPDDRKKGYPEGHVPIKKFISIPVFYEGKIHAVVGAANKKEDYDEEDVLNLNLLMNTVWSNVERIRAEEKLRKSGEDLLKFAAQVPGMLYQFEMLPDGRFRVPFTTNGITDIFRCAPEDVRDDFAPIGKYIHPEDLTEIIEAIHESAKLLSPFQMEYRVLLPGEPVHWVMARSMPEKLVNGSILFHGFNTDITERKAAEESLMKEKELFQTTLFSITDGIIVTDIFGKVILMNPMAESYTGWVKEEAYGKDFELVFHTFDMMTKDNGFSPVKIDLEKGRSIEYPKNQGLISKDGSERSIAGKISGIYSQNGEMTGMVVAFRDVTKEYSLEKEIEGFLNVNLDMLCVSDRDGNLHKVNRKFEDILGYSSEEIEGKPFISFVHEEDIQYTLGALAGIQENGAMTNLVNRYRCRNGAYKYIEWNILYGAGKFMYISARDVTEKKIYEEELKRLAIKDDLTGLYNRNYFEAIIQESMDHSDRYNEPLSMLLLDLDYFKKVNDTWGHPIGDELLKQTAQTIGQTIRDSDTLVRFGGEEFVALLPQTSREGAATAAEKIRAAIEKNSHPVTGLQTVSIGVAQRMNSESFRHWYRRLDDALYQAKQNGRNRVVLSNELERPPVASVNLAWRKEWESGNKDIDGQHKEMIEIANRLINMTYEGMKHLEIVSQLERLLSHILSHFTFEVKLLTIMGYPDYLHHAEIHNNLVAKALRLKEAYENGGINASAFFSFVVDDVILGHLVEEDTKFFPYMKKKI